MGRHPRYTGDVHPASSIEKREASPSIVVFAHKRTDVLRVVLGALARCSGFDEHRLVVVIDGGSPEVEKIVRDNTSPDVLVITAPEPEKPALGRMNRAFRGGLNMAFDYLAAPFTIVLDDDVIVSKDFLTFHARVHAEYGAEKRFRGVNAFSPLSRKDDAFLSNSSITHINYGYSWGWSINRRAYERIKKVFAIEGLEDSAPDALAEMYLRTGYMVNPALSRVYSMGFDSSATHTNDRQAHLTGVVLERSFKDHQESSPLGEEPFLLSEARFVWGKECVNLLRLGGLDRKKLFLFSGVREWAFMRKHIWNGVASAFALTIERLIIKFVLRPLSFKSQRRSPGRR